MKRNLPASSRWCRRLLIDCLTLGILAVLAALELSVLWEWRDWFDRVPVVPVVSQQVYAEGSELPPWVVALR